MASKFTIISLTNQGTIMGRKLIQELSANPAIEAKQLVPERFRQADEISFAKGTLRQVIQQEFAEADCIVCIMATGIVIRSIAEVVQDKTVDPAVLVLDEQGHHVISLLSGHVGGANEWATLIGRLLDADPVITTATDTENVQSLDMLAKQLHAWYPNFRENTRVINGKLAANEPVYLYIEPYYQPLVNHLRGFTIVDSLDGHDTSAPLVVVSDRDVCPKHEHLIQVVPRLNVLGVGCRKNVTYQMMQQTFADFCHSHQLLWQSFDRIASIDVKAHESAIQYLGQTLDVPCQFYSAAELANTGRTYPESEFVRKTVGVGNVACAAADVGSGQQPASERFSENEITMSFSRLVSF